MVVSGRVQAVAFRHYTKLCADELGVKGWVKNLTDGNVLINVAGNKEKVRSLIKWCHKGPGSAHVDKLVYHMIAPFESEGFIIDR